MGQAASQWWVELLRALPSIVTAGTAIFGVFLAKAGLEKWRRETIGKRKAELAEEVLADFYQARDVINAARSPGSFSEEGNTRQKAERETEADTRRLNAYYSVAERLFNKGEFFAELHARRYRYLALFGTNSVKSYDELFRIRSEITTSVQMLVMTYDKRQFGSLPQDCRNWEGIIWEGINKDDRIPARLTEIVEAVEKTCRPAIQEAVQ